MATGSERSHWLRYVPLLSLLATLIFGSGWFREAIWNVPDLVYSSSGTVKIQGQYITILTLENRGRVPSRDIEIVVAQLNTKLSAVEMPPPHETAEITAGGVDEDNVTIKLDRLVPGSVLSVYLVTPESINLRVGENLLLVSERGNARARSEGPSQTEIGLLAILVGLIVAEMIVVILRTFPGLTHRIRQWVSDEEER